MSDPQKPVPAVLRRAEFNRQVRVYWLLNGILLLTVTLIGIPLLLLWIPLGLWVTERYLRRLECVLTEKSLKVGKGLLVRVEKTVPLDKITDLGLVQGPLMRWLGLEALSIETAGQSSAGALVRMVGIQDARSFRDAVLEQRDRVVAAAQGEAPTPAGSHGTTSGLENGDQLLIEIRDSLHRIEQKIEQKV